MRAFGVVGAAAAGWAAFVRVNYEDVRAVGAGSPGSAGNGVEGVAASSGWSSRCWASCYCCPRVHRVRHERDWMSVGWPFAPYYA